MFIVLHLCPARQFKPIMEGKTMGMRCCWVSLLLGIIFLLNCSLSEPEAPSWDATLNFPVTDNTILMTDLINDYENIFNYDDGLLGLRAEGDLDTTWVGNNFVVDDIEEIIDLVMSNIDISHLCMDTLVFSPAEFIPEASLFYNQQRVIDPVEFSDVYGRVLSEQNILEVNVATGVVQLTFTNNLPIEIVLTEIKLVDLLTSRLLVVSTDRVTIPSGASEILPLDISGKRLTSTSQWFLTGSSPGSNGKEVVVDSDDSIVLTVDLVDLKLAGIKTKSDGFHIEQMDSVIIGEAVSIRKATFNSGQMSFGIENDLPINLEIDIQAIQFLNKSTKDPLHIQVFVEKNSTARTEIQIKNYEINFEGELETPQSVHFITNVRGIQDDEEIISVSGNDAIKFVFGMQSVVIDDFAGRLAEYKVGIKPIMQHVPLPQNLDQFHGLNLSDARLNIEFFNTIDMPIQLEGILIGFAANGKKTSLPISGDLTPGQLGHEVATQLIYDATENENVLELVGLPPERVQFSGTTFVGRGMAEGFISSESYIRAHYVLETPAHLAWKDTEFTPDTTYFQVNPENYSGKKLRNDVIVLSAKDVNQLESFELLTEIVNHTPVSGVIEFYLKENRSQSAESRVWVSPVEVKMATLDLQGRTETSWENQKSIELDEDALSIFKNYVDDPKLVLFITKVKMHSTHGTKVKLYNSDYLIIRSKAQLSIGINKN